MRSIAARKILKRKMANMRVIGLIIGIVLLNWSFQDSGVQRWFELAGGLVMLLSYDVGVSEEIEWELTKLKNALFDPPARSADVS